MRRCSLYIDESGDFAHQPIALVAGLLVQAPWSADLHRAMRRALEQAAGCVAWPPHAYALNSVANLRKAVAKNDATPTARLARALDRGDDAVAKDAIDTARAALRRALEALPTTVGAPVYVVGAMSDHAARERPRRYGQLRADAYLEALAATFARVTLVLRDAPTIVDCFVAHRNVVVDALGVPAALTPTFVHQVAQAAMSGIPGADNVIFAQHGIERFRAPEGGVVAADQVSNRLFGAFGANPVRSWANVTALSADVLGLPVAAPAKEGALPTFGAAGTPHARVVTAARGEAPAPGGAGWKHEQADAWVAVLR